MSSALSVNGFLWVSSPAATELETVRRVCSIPIRVSIPKCLLRPPQACVTNWKAVQSTLHRVLGCTYPGRRGLAGQDDGSSRGIPGHRQQWQKGQRRWCCSGEMRVPVETRNSHRCLQIIDACAIERTLSCVALHVQAGIPCKQATIHTSDTRRSQKCGHCRQRRANALWWLCWQPAPARWRDGPYQTPADLLLTFQTRSDPVTGAVLAEHLPSVNT